MGARFELSEEVVRKCLVKTVTAPPLGAALEGADQCDDLARRKPCKLVIEPGIPGTPLLPQVVGHTWDSPHGESKCAWHGRAGTMALAGQQRGV